MAYLERGEDPLREYAETPVMRRWAKETPSSPAYHA